jgi:hypothetical protein
MNAVKKMLTSNQWLIEKNEMGGACSSDGEGRGAYSCLVGKPEGNRPLERSRRRWEDNIKTMASSVAQ